jgi:hypothetical protein
MPSNLGTANAGEKLGMDSASENLGMENAIAAENNLKKNKKKACVVKHRHLLSPHHQQSCG